MLVLTRKLSRTGSGPQATIYFTIPAIPDPIVLRLKYAKEQVCQFSINEVFEYVLRSVLHADPSPDLSLPVSGYEQPIALKVLAASSKHARIGIVCDRKIGVMRGEIYDRTPQKHGR